MKTGDKISWINISGLIKHLHLLIFSFIIIEQKIITDILFQLSSIK